MKEETQKEERRNKNKLAWRNWIAHWTSNPEVVGSSPTVSFYSFTHTFRFHICILFNNNNIHSFKLLEFNNSSRTGMVYTLPLPTSRKTTKRSVRSIGLTRDRSQKKNDSNASKRDTGTRVERWCSCETHTSRI